jgi:hypothetical protein
VSGLGLLGVQYERRIIGNSAWHCDVLACGEMGETRDWRLLVGSTLCKVYPYMEGSTRCPSFIDWQWPPINLLNLHFTNTSWYGIW